MKAALANLIRVVVVHPRQPIHSFVQLNAVETGKLGKIEAHLDLGWLYNAAGLKDRAIVEYEEVLRKKPDYHDRKKLEQYIGENKKP
jgi:lipopolysaccharide biosynthesis regulator YciM